MPGEGKDLTAERAETAEYLPPKGKNKNHFLTVFAPLRSLGPLRSIGILYSPIIDYQVLNSS